MPKPVPIYSDSKDEARMTGFKLVGEGKSSTKSQPTNDFALYIQSSQTYIDFQKGIAR